MARVAAVQMCSGQDLNANLAQLDGLIEQAVASNAELLLLPENFALLDSQALIELAFEESRSPSVLNRLKQIAHEKGIWLIAGSFPWLCDSPQNGKTKVFSRSLLIDPQGELKAHYDKVHLFDVDVEDKHAAYRESDYFTPGKELVVEQTSVGCFGLSICYDLRFPEHYQRLADMGANIMLVPSAFTAVTGKAHWEVLLRARAIETQSYVIAANQAGKHTASRSSWGHSMIVDPWGKVLAECHNDGPGLAVADIDLQEVRNRRKAMPVTLHRAKAGF
ncbi:carbon-nitrogen hydrolase family protein [Neptuniibacter caesariensis]|uniref:Putative carbon-nitrogen hydrolase n=1 Tax=Neptuniibacter caesariensis TaxID=207954 RepID=A0A7U8C3X4_NEPCE|nr:carbon-nitrogen hydrolase family protein [Neptuniibacter caesariensis]EAR61053.1 putative carbon-nitrogen hydrolase [Neptuniibacter caesariensis]